MTVTQIKYFIETAKSLNFTKAAQNLYVTEQAVSKQIRALEREINIKLLERNTKKVTLTEGGKLLFTIWDSFLQDMEKGLHQAEKLSSLKKEKVRIGIIELSPLIDTLIPLISSNKLSDIDTEYEFETGTFSHMREVFNNGRVDMLISLTTELPSNISPSNLEILTHMEPKIVLAKDHPLANKNELTLRDLKEETFYILENSNAENEILSFCRLVGFSPKNIKYFKSIDSMEISLNMGNGVTIAFDIFFRNTKQLLKFFPFQDHNGPPDIVIAWKNPIYAEYAKELKALLPKYYTETIRNLQ